MAQDNSPGPIPPIPKTATIPIITPTQFSKGEAQVPTSLSFFYAGISSVWIWYKAPIDILRAYLNPLGMTPYDFGDGYGAVNINFFNAIAFYGQGQPGNKGVGGFNETELNIIGYATKVAENVPQGLTLEQFLMAGDPTKRVGNYRVWVACDDAIAVALGRQVFMENKFLVPYTYNIPGANNPRPAPNQFTYDWKLHDPDTPTESWIYSASVKLDGLSSVPANTSEIIDLSVEPASGRPVASRRNYLGMFDTFLQPSVANAVALAYGGSTHTMRHDMEKLIGTSSPSALQLFKSPTCIAEAAGYYADL